MKFFRLLFLLSILLVGGSAKAFWHGSASGGGGTTHSSELSLLNPFDSGEFAFINLLKGAQNWDDGNNHPIYPDEADSNGYPNNAAEFSARGGALALVAVPSQFERPGHFVVSWTGGYSVSAFNNLGGSTFSACLGGTAGHGGVCDNTSCSSFTGSIAVTTLTVTVAPTGTGCGLAQNVPITWGANGGISTFGTPTIITAQLTGTAGGIGTYTVSQSQTVLSTTMFQGGRFEFDMQNSPTLNLDFVKLVLSAVAAHGSISISVYHIGDETAWINSATPCGRGLACIAGTEFSTRIKQANWGVLRNLDWIIGNNSMCTTWSSRRGSTYWGYADGEMRNAIAGTETYTVQGHSYTVPHPGQYVNAGGTGASGGTVSYNSGTDTYSVTLGSGAPVDKQTMLVRWPANGTQTSKLAFNGGSAIQILDYGGFPLTAVGEAAPPQDIVWTLVWNKDFGAWLRVETGMNCLVPPEVFIEINAELGTTPWFNVPPYALDAMTDWITQEQTYLKSVYTPPLKPRIEPANEIWNSAAGVNDCYFLTNLSSNWVAKDTAWTNSAFCGNSGNTYGELGKIMSTVGQDLNVVYGAGNYELSVSLQTGFGGAAVANEALQSNGWVNQNPSNIPIQAGYVQNPSYMYTTRGSNATYWSVDAFNQNAEGLLAFCYYNYSISSSCQAQYASQAAVMAAYVSSPLTVAGENGQVLQWSTWAKTCSFVTRPAGCAMNSTTPIMFYEGGYNEVSTLANFAQTAVGASPSGSNTILSISGAGCATGQTVALANAVGSTSSWASANGNYVIQASGTDSSHCAINLNSSTFGNLYAATFNGGNCVGGGSPSIDATSVVGFIGVGMAIPSGVNPGIQGGTTVLSQTSGTTGGAGTYVISQQCFIGSPSVALIAGPTINYPGSKNFINTLRNMSYLAPEMDTWSTNIMNGVLANGGSNPSQYQMASGGSNSAFGSGPPITGNPWYVFAPTVYGNYLVGICDGCSISGTTLTLGSSSIQGFFRVGDALAGFGVTGFNTGAASNTTITSCTQVGTGPCGTNVGDTLGLSQASTVGQTTTATGNTVFSGATIFIGSCTGVNVQSSIFDVTTGVMVAAQNTVLSCSGGNISVSGGAQGVVTTGDHLIIGTKMVGNAVPPANQAGNGNTSPVRAFGAICRFNGNGNQCNGWLLKRDIDPASNDNDPVGLEKAA